MLTTTTINQILKTKPTFILSVNYNESIGDMLGDESNNEYLAEMTIQYHSLTNNACLSFTVECLVSVTDNKVTIEQMNTCENRQALYIENIEGLPYGLHYVWQDIASLKFHSTLVDLIESQPIDDIPEHFIIEAY